MKFSIIKSESEIMNEIYELIDSVNGYSESSSELEMKLTWLEKELQAFGDIAKGWVKVVKENLEDVKSGLELDYLYIVHPGNFKNLKNLKNLIA